MESVIIFVGMRLRARQDSRGCLCAELQRRYKCLVNFRRNDLHAEFEASDDYS